MSQLIDDLLSLSRTTKGELMPGQVDVSGLGRAILAELQSADPTRQVRLIIPDGLTAHADRRLLRVALENLLSNAWKFTRGRPSPTVEIDGRRVFSTTARSLWASPERGSATRAAR
jgi:signal transduction histidine kinase